jgi:hypothetical protein
VNTLAILATVEITPEDFVDMYADLEIVELCGKHDKMDELIDYIYDMYSLGTDTEEGEVAHALERDLEELKAEFGIV